MSEIGLPPALELPIIGYLDVGSDHDFGAPDPGTEMYRVEDERMRLVALSRQSLAALRLFAEVLTVGRLGRGWLGSSRWDLVDHLSLDPGSEDEVLVPHVFRHEAGRGVGIVFEWLPWAAAVELLGAPRQTIGHWSKMPGALVELVRMAPRRVPTDGYLSFRWVVNNEVRAAEALARARSIDFEHVSLSVDASDLDWVVHLLRDLIGLIEVSRPPSISVPGAWFVAGGGMIHLNGREVAAGGGSARGSAPNHVALRVGAVDGIAQRLDAAGVNFVADGSLSDRVQLWIHLPGGSVLELQGSPAIA